MKKYKVNFFDKNGTETRSVTVDANNEDQAEDMACEYAENEGWSKNFKVADAEEI